MLNGSSSFPVLFEKCGGCDLFVATNSGVTAHLPVDPEHGRSAAAHVPRPSGQFATREVWALLDRARSVPVAPAVCRVDAHGGGAGDTFVVEVDRTVRVSVSVTAADPEAAVTLVDSRLFPLPAVGDSSATVIEGITYAVYSLDGRELYRED